MSEVFYNFNSPFLLQPGGAYFMIPTSSGGSKWALGVEVLDTQLFATEVQWLVSYESAAPFNWRFFPRGILTNTSGQLYAVVDIPPGTGYRAVGMVPLQLPRASRLLRVGYAEY